MNIVQSVGDDWMIVVRVGEDSVLSAKMSPSKASHSNLCGTCNWVVDDPQEVFEVCPQCGAQAYYLPVTYTEKKKVEKLNLKEHIESLVNDQLAEYIADKVKAQLRNNWDLILSEMVSLRKLQYKLEEKVNTNLLLDERLESLIEQLQVEQAKTARMQAKEDRLLDFLLKDFGIEED